MPALIGPHVATAGTVAGLAASAVMITHAVGARYRNQITLVIAALAVLVTLYLWKAEPPGSA